MQKWYALNGQGRIVYLGEFNSFWDADESTEFSTVWILDEQSAKDWLNDLNSFNIGKE